MSHQGVNGVIITQNNRQPIFTTLDNNKTFMFANRLSDLKEMAEHTIRTIDPEDELMVMRIRTSKYEIMSVLPTETQSIIVIQHPNQ